MRAAFPSNAKRDLVDTFQVPHTNQVPHYWIADPVEKTLIVHRWEPRGYLVVVTARLGDVIRAEPFESAELRLWPTMRSATPRQAACRMGQPVIMVSARLP